MIKILLFVLALLSAALENSAQPNATATFENIKVESGTLPGGLYNTEAKFPGNPHLALNSAFKSDGVDFTFKSIPDGIFVSGYLDKFDTGELDTTLGIVQSEPYGGYNKSPACFGLPAIIFCSLTCVSFLYR